MVCFKYVSDSQRGACAPPMGHKKNLVTRESLRVKCMLLGLKKKNALVDNHAYRDAYQADSLLLCYLPGFVNVLMTPEKQNQLRCPQLYSAFKK